jgi:hypothetical protein
MEKGKANRHAGLRQITRTPQKIKQSSANCIGRATARWLLHGNFKTQIGKSALQVGGINLIKKLKI